MKKKEAKGRPVIVTTEYRGVFFGYAKSTSGSTIRLERARMCVYWSQDMQGIFGLAERGPSATCRISPAATVELRKVTAVIEVSPEAVTKWEAQPWQK
jgi:hypothetical protein